MHINYIKVYKEWITKLKHINELLNSLSSSTEQDFLIIGEDLGNFFIETEKISNLSESLVSFMTGEKVSGAVSHLKILLEEIKKFSESSQEDLWNNIEKLEDIQKKIKLLEKPMDEVKKIVQMLLMLGISTRIESAHLGAKDVGFNILARDIKELSSNINKKLDNIIDQDYFLQDLLEETSKQALFTDKDNRKHLKKILEKLNSSLTTLESIFQISIKVAENNAQTSRIISDNMAEIISSLQFHDITRQQIEHVEEAINELIKSLRDKINLIKEIDNENSDTLEPAYIAGDVLRIQRAQLYNSNSHLNKAVENIISNLKGVFCEVKDFSLNSKNSDLNLDQKTFSILNTTQKGIDSALSSLKSISKSQKQLAKIIISTTEKSKNIAKYINEIDQTGSYIELIALNAQVKAAHTGRQGVALSIIAESIQKVSLNSKVQTIAFLKILKEISKSNTNLKELINNSINTRNSQVEDIIGTSKEVMDTLNQLKQNSNPIIEEIEKLRLKLSKNINNCLTNINVHQKASNIFNEVLDDLNIIFNQIIELVPSIDLSDNFDELNNLKDRYTMESERKVHISALSPKIKSNKEVEECNFDEDELGDNVELF